MRGVVREARGRIRLRPAAGILQRLRQIPVIERGQRPDAGFQHRIREPLVVVQTAGVGRAAAGGLNARPGDGESIGLQIQLLQQRDVVLVAMIAVAGDIARGAVLDVCPAV